MYTLHDHIFHTIINGKCASSDADEFSEELTAWALALELETPVIFEWWTRPIHSQFDYVKVGCKEIIVHKLLPEVYWSKNAQCNIALRKHCKNGCLEDTIPEIDFIYEHGYSEEYWDNKSSLSNVTHQFQARHQHSALHHL